MDGRIGGILGMPQTLRVIGVMAPVPRTRSRGHLRRRSRRPAGPYPRAYCAQLGSPALSMNQTPQQDRGVAICRASAVGTG